jgi:hypothetical protein
VSARYVTRRSTEGNLDVHDTETGTVYPFDLMGAEAVEFLNDGRLSPAILEAYDAEELAKFHPDLAGR